MECVVQTQEFIPFRFTDGAVLDFPGEFFMALPLCHQVDAVADAKAMLAGIAVLRISTHLFLR